MKTFIKTFREDNRIRVESLANNYAANHNLEIINVSYTVRSYDGFDANDTHYLAVVFKEKEK